ncbi:MAG: hypothetical protein KDK97_01965 [Verrucomicrobiales bacterium]|nr:hypothetical protein [Verrucomicrobiales bacterium]MCP5556267.1 hypothetical protein [Verrucomicrobiaceae bacterium]
MKTACVIAVIALHFVPSSSLANDGGPGAFNPERRTIFTCLSWDEAIPRLYFRTLHHWTEHRSEPAEARRGALVVVAEKGDAPNTVRSTAHGYLGPQVIEFFAVAPPNVAVEEDFHIEPIARATIPFAATRCLFLFFKQTPPPNEPNLRYRVQTLEDSLLDLPQGSYLVFNATRRNLIGAYDETRFDVPAGNRVLLRPDITDGGNGAWRFWDAAEAKKPIHSSMWRHRAAGRFILFINSDPEHPAGLKVKAIPEFGQPPLPDRDPPALP